jgi:magnesium-transporting ATPase (P-type)
MSGKSGGGSPVVMMDGDLKKPLNLLLAISEIQKTGAIEKDLSGPIDSNILSTINRWDFFSIGLRNALLNGLVSLFLTPLSLGVFFKLIAVFNDTDVSLFDKIYILFFNFSMSIGFGMFLSRIKESYVGTLSKGMTKSLLGGFALGEFIKIVIIFILFNWIYIKMNATNIYRTLLFFKTHTDTVPFVKNMNYVHAYYWLMNFRNVFPVSAMLVLVSSLFVIGIPIAYLAYFAYKQKKEFNI